MDAYVDYNSPLLDVLSTHHLAPPGRHYEDVGPAGDLGKIPCPRMADGHGGVLAQEKLREWLADEVRAPDDYRFPACELHAIALQEPDDPVRGAGQEAREADG
jgi:hypothetical protein